MELPKNAWDIELPERLDQEVQKEYIERLLQKEGDCQQYANALIYHNLRLVTFTLKKYYPFWKRVCPELISVGIEEFINSVYSYGKRGNNLNSSFETYVIGRVRYSIWYYLHKEGRFAQNVSLNEKLDPSRPNSETFEESISIDPTLEECYEENEIHSTIRNLVEQLPEPKKTIIKMHFGFNEEERSYRQQEIADFLQVKQPTISKILKKTYKELKTMLEETELGAKERQKRKTKKR